jgi:hypothetical protein
MPSCIRSTYFALLDVKGSSLSSVFHDRLRRHTVSFRSHCLFYLSTNDTGTFILWFLRFLSHRLAIFHAS